MTCDQARHRLSAEIDSELALEEAVAVHRHLESCPDCERKATLLRQTRDAFRTAALPARGPRPVTLAAIAGMLVLTVVAARGLFRPGAPPPSPKRDVPAAAAAAGDDARPERSLDTIDCGLPGAAVCFVDQPCADDRCAPRAPGLLIP